jgi:serine/threonine protein kinase
MHSFDPPYAHNDVKPGNVLITRRRGKAPLATLMDFGSSRPAKREIRSRSEALRLQVCLSSMQFSGETALYDTILAFGFRKSFVRKFGHCSVTTVLYSLFGCLENLLGMLFCF